MYRQGGGVMTGLVRLVMLMLVVAAHATHTQEEKLLGIKQPQISVAEVKVRSRDGPGSQREPRTPDIDAHQRSDASFWASRGKRPDPGARYARSAEKDLKMPWAPVGEDHQTLQRHNGNEGAAIGLGNDGEAPGTTFWVSRGKKDLTDYLPFYWGSNQGMWGATLPRSSWAAPPRAHHEQQDAPPRPSLPHSGWESNQSLWGKRNSQGPYWVARGKREEEDGPFWISRGKRPQELQAPPNNSPLWAARGRKSGDEAFWVARGKKANSDPSTNPFWIARGKKDEIAIPNAPFWVARGKKDVGTNPEAPFWIARGKKDEVSSANAPFWVARGKKDDVTTMTTPYWIARGKKDVTPPFWISRGKKEGTAKNFWVARGKKEAEKYPFWIARGKRRDEDLEMDDDDDDDVDDDKDDEREIDNEMTYILETLMTNGHNATHTQVTGEKETLLPGEVQKQRHPFLKSLVALRE